MSFKDGHLTSFCFLHWACLVSPKYTFPSPEDLPDPGIEPGSSALQADALPSEPPGKPEEKNRCIQRFALFTEVYYKEHRTGIWELMHLSLNRWVKLCNLFKGTVYLMYLMLYA